MHVGSMGVLSEPGFILKRKQNIFSPGKGMRGRAPNLQKAWGKYYLYFSNGIGKELRPLL